MAEHQVRIVLALHRKNEQRRRRFSFLEVDADHHLLAFARANAPRWWLNASTLHFSAHKRGFPLKGNSSMARPSLSFMKDLSLRVLAVFGTLLFAANTKAQTINFPIVVPLHFTQITGGDYKLGIY